jgi:tRNA1Val (adenine37-N6)-methyltransferase
MNTDITLNEGEKIEDLGHGYRIIQNPAYFPFGTDAVLLADFASMKAGERAVDLGTGCGIIPILMCARTSGIHVTGLEIQQTLVEMARRSVTLNGLEDSIDIVQGDLKRAAELIKPGVDVVVANPPYEKTGAGKESPNEYLNIAKREVRCTLDDVVSAAAKLLRTGGRFYLIYRTERFAELMERMRAYKVEPKRIMLVSQRQGDAPNFALVEGRKGAGEGVKFLPALAVYEADGSYTKQAKSIYRMEEK